MSKNSPPQALPLCRRPERRRSRSDQSIALRSSRLLIAQAIVEGILLLTSGPLVARYPGSIRKV